MINYIISKKNIFLAEIVIFEDIENGFLIRKEIPDIERQRLVLVKDHFMIDFKTGDQILPYETENNQVMNGSIYKNQMYCDTIYTLNPETISDANLLYAASLYENFLRKQELIKQRKLILFPKEKLF